MSIRNSFAFLLLALTLFTGRALAAPAAAPPPPAKTVVLVHGAFADGSSWNAVVPLLQAKGLKVIVVQNPLSSLADDVQFTSRAIAEAKGPVVLVGHSWGGVVITQAGNDDKVKALVYVAAFAPSVGQSLIDTVKAFPPAPGMGALQPDAAGFVKLPADAVAKYFASDLPAAQANLIAVSQGALNGKSVDEKVTKAAWETRPSWYVVGEKDQMFNPDAQRDAAKKIKATVTALPTSHVAMLSKPQDVANVIIAAANSIK
jgi:pimeloyl-ACP methyl ester carboxylesterase